MEHVAITFTTAPAQVKEVDARVSYHRVNRSWLLRKLVAKGLESLTDQEIEIMIAEDPRMSAPKGVLK